jgi:SAM-dependent methyltransferase
MALAQKYFKDEVVELGCGGGFNLIGLAKLFRVQGLDRSEAAVAAAKAAGLTAYVCGDLRTDCSTLTFPSGAGVLTCDSMEQLGADWELLFERLCAHDGTMVHIEPLEELYDDSEFDQVAKRFHQAKGYLKGYLTKLRSDPRVEILEERRVRIGSTLNDGFSYVVWRRK